MSEAEKGKKGRKRRAPRITVAGVSFTADEVKSAVIEKDGREIEIGEKEDKPKRIGF